MVLFLVKLLSKLILPPGLFIILLIILFILLQTSQNKYSYRKNKRKYLYGCLILLLILIYLFSSYPGEFLLTKPLESQFDPLLISNRESKVGNSTAIVLLGSGVRRGTSRGVEIGEITLARLYRTWQIHKETGLDLVVSGGVVPGADNTSGAEVMKEVLLDLGVKEDKIILEKKAKNTWQNAVNTALLLEEREYEQIILVTSALHMKRAVYSFERNCNQRLIPAPANYTFNTDVSLLDYLPNRESLDNSLAALHEWIGLVWYSFK
ncbi:YdcF family protein [Acetohalobium arabaticum]|uniref:DUF218 domain-containing protein n=1 Tax=Acetohalobium arabaticum (strain ATCC 49924 / DSM 5501 / Z-7288) TaxID=574087 RepID=D9QQP8_ACEAZ|nr:YdcF family protein [Acetohalobium arabaticum]ADL12839.1 protein of unknown function DUF218 [Acetohalobium arabaticum DSM 5501]